METVGHPTKVVISPDFGTLVSRSKYKTNGSLTQKGYLPGLGVSTAQRGYRAPSGC
jgi:hypothetical protein